MSLSCLLIDLEFYTDRGSNLNYFDLNHPSDTSIELLRDPASGYLHDVGTCSAVKIGESQGTIDDKVIQECTKEIGIPPVLCESSEKQGDDLPVSITKDDKETLNENDDKSSPKKLGNL